MAALSFFRYLPIVDKAGRVSAIKSSSFVLVVAPLLWMAGNFIAGFYMANPLKQLTLQTGLWAIRFLILTLCITPFRRIGHWPKLIKVRRMLGLAALFYLILHFFLYVIDQKFDLVFVAKEIVARLYLSIGFIALAGLAVLGVTSTDAMIKRLGADRWNALHRWIYVLCFFGLLHFMMQAKLVIAEPVFMTGVFVFLMIYRLLHHYRFSITPLLLVGLSSVVGILTAFVEFGWYAAFTGVNPWRVLNNNLDVMAFARPALWVLPCGIGVALVAYFRQKPVMLRS